MPALVEKLSDIPPQTAALVPVALLTGYAVWNVFKLASLTRPDVQRE